MYIGKSKLEGTGQAEVSKIIQRCSVTCHHAFMHSCSSMLHVHIMQMLYQLSYQGSSTEQAKSRNVMQVQRHLSSATQVNSNSVLDTCTGTCAT